MKKYFQASFSSLASRLRQRGTRYHVCFVMQYLLIYYPGGQKNPEGGVKDLGNVLPPYFIRRFGRNVASCGKYEQQGCTNNKTD